MPYDVKKHQSLRFDACAYRDKRIETCLHLQSHFVFLHANINSALTQSRF